MKCKQCCTSLKFGLEFCPSCGMKVGILKEYIYFLLTLILKNSHVGIYLLASLILFISFTIHHNTIATSIMLYDIPVWGMIIYYYLGLNLLWYTAITYMEASLNQKKFGVEMLGKYSFFEYYEDGITPKKQILKVYFLDGTLDYYLITDYHPDGSAEQNNFHADGTKYYTIIYETNGAIVQSFDY